ncbi:hypothetical protein NV379_02955 [Paenibacillus sp. N1-5-1-14]|uniref:hypothetical protein n=1 Tax=Paenibacillus radicibacter TaxID=2972488 RepID=UPI002158A738|nr:hypothetical protein [Paenibacillus radicibacter]MCR8641606.1 hypothetical protein [Paenibacillus radicibacter]
MSINELRAQYRSSKGRVKQGFVSPIGEVNEEQLKEIVVGNGAEPRALAQGWTQNNCTYRPEDIPFC